MIASSWARPPVRSKSWQAFQGKWRHGSMRILMSASIKPTFLCSMTGPVPSRFSVRAKSSAYSKAARMVPTHAAPISAAVQLNAAATTRLPCRPGSPIRLSAGTRTSSKHARGHHASVAELVVHVDHGDARSGSRHGDHGERVVGARVGIGAADDGVQLASRLVPPGAVGRVVLLAGEHPLVTVTAGGRLDAAGGVR